MTERKAPTGFIGPSTLDTTWQTPQILLDCVRLYYGGVIPADVCTAPNNPANALRFWTEGALAKPWPAQWYCNPPYGKALIKGGWLEKIATEGTLTEGICLLSAARWEQWPMQYMLTKAKHLCFIRKRVDFVRAETGEPVSGNTYANFFVGFNTDWNRWADAFSVAGVCLQLGESTVPPITGLKIPRGKRNKKQ